MPIKILLIKLRRAWMRVQISYRGRYSIERFLSLEEYIRRTSRARVFVVCLGTPLPMVAFVLLVECVPLQDPNAGWSENIGIWVRSAVICSVIAFTMLVELKNLIEEVAISVLQTIFVLVCVVVVDIALCMAVAAYLAFPIPFMSIVMVPPLLAIVAISLRIAFGTQTFKKMVSHHAQIFGFVLFIMAQAATLVIYPVYQVLFNAVTDTKFELPVLFLLPIIKILMKNVVAESIDYMEDMMPESIIFTVDFFNAVYMATCMQRTSSTITVATVMAVDIIRSVITLQSLYGTSYELQRQVNREMRCSGERLNLLEVGCSICQNVDRFARQELSKIQLRSCLPHKLSQAGKIQLSRLENASRRASANSPHPTSRILQRTLEILFRSECLVLTEYLGSFVPICYANFVCVMVQLPSVQYHTELDGITPATVRDTVQSVFTYGGLEIVSFLALLVVIQRTISLRALYHLAFVLETQMALVQSKLTVWMLLTLTFRVVHYGAFADR
ncbi:hypothetical protein PHYSODRAFT_517031 [Phytophthora sojae]|uniref:Uncharacterized protein n=1 Tax=Phytophthora sojae (strain P6497) TaxID=1094619 RepID=G4ZY94_PHYSP|nr:hypothetical protein PHYSODRAFT_517031 [Phytophthora sojae]EGZ12706.1 hypothetical protein PHYSODRAFT_517031 [Phytophthora sojae]|eukprot:XP_009533039.1 hypothetical protein PHYSODRAFT_517031 [Phytophthora sojae]